MSKRIKIIGLKNEDENRNYKAIDIYTLNFYDNTHVATHSK